MRLAAALVAAAVLLACAACGAGVAHRARTARTPLPQLEAKGPAFGLTEDNADLLWSPSAAPDGPFSAARSELSALHPTYLRLFVDWAALQPSGQRPADLEAPVDGCARETGPCGAYAGVRAELEAIASQQRALGPGAFQVVIVILGVPAWAAAAPSGCEVSGAEQLARALSSSALPSYRALIASLLKLGAQTGVALRWWSPWNEPNDPRFINPQRASCSTNAPPSSVAVYAQLARAMREALHAARVEAHMVLGELQGLTVNSPHTTSIQQFVADIPEEVACLASVWSVHAYASYAPAAGAYEPVAALQSALDARGGCASHKPIWVTESGTGAPHAGEQRSPGAAVQREGCEALATQLERWSEDPRIGAVFQYTFREDPDFQVGLLSADLEHLYPAYGLWLRYARLHAAGRPPPAGPAACGA